MLSTEVEATSVAPGRATDLPVGPGPSLEAISTPERWVRVASEWDALAREREAFYLAYPWLRTWWNHYGEGRLDLALVRHGLRTAAVAPLRRTQRMLWGVPARMVENLFNPHTCRSDVALADDTDGTLELILDHIDREPWDVVKLREIPEESIFSSRLPEACARRGWSLRTRHSLDSPYVVVEGSWEDYFGRRSRTFRKKLRAKHRKLDASGLEARYECLHSPADVDATLPEIMDLALESWSGERGSSIASPKHRGFYDPMIREMAARGLLRLWTLRLDGALAAFEVHLQWERQSVPLKACFHPRFAELSPGSLLEEHALEAIFRGGESDVYDLLGDAAFYKMRWTDRVRVHHEVFLFNRRPRSRLLEALEFRLRPHLGAVKRALLRGSGGKERQ